MYATATPPAQNDGVGGPTGRPGGDAPEMIIAGRFNGPDGSGNGGYSAGLFALAASGGHGDGVEVTLRLPPPLDTPLELVDGRVLTRQRRTSGCSTLPCPTRAAARSR